MAMRNRNFRWQMTALAEYIRPYSSNSKVVDFKKLRPMILERIENRSKDYPLQATVPVAQGVLKARVFLFQGVSTLMQKFPVWTCKYCRQVYIGEKGHLIQTCGGYKHRTKNQAHSWIKGSLHDVLVHVEAFHLHNMFQNVLKHDQRFDFDRVPAVLELCLQAGVNPADASHHLQNFKLDSDDSAVAGAESLLSADMRMIAISTLNAWESLRSGVQKLLLVYPVKVCKYCSEVHIGPSGHKARLCGSLKYERWRGKHLWKKAEVDDLVPPNIVWSRRPQDPPVLLNEGREYYGHAPAVVDLCSKAGAIVPSKYFCMMKVHGLSSPT